ncbi:MAG: SDR family oxidoreductase [Tissierellia bacterium]|nr:SDR family oxidoreductase [Tissierellia bacterium]
MRFKDRVVVITGGANGIGKQIALDFEREGAKVCIIDRNENSFYMGDVSKKKDLEDFAKKVLNRHEKIDVLVNNAPPKMVGINEGSYEDIEEALRAGAISAYYLTKLFMGHFTNDASIINISSTRANMSQSQTESYTMTKGAISALTHALAMSLAGRVRVNTVLPGWIDTTDTQFEGADNDQHMVKRVGRPSDISNVVLFLASNEASFIDGQEIVVDGGMMKTMIYSGDEGWKLNNRRTK